MKKYLRIYWQFVKINLSLLSVYRANLLNHFINSLTWSGFIIIAIFFLTERLTSIAGWDRSHLLLLAGMYNLVMGLFYMLFSRSFRDLAPIIFYGKLDSYLLKPIDSQFHVSLREVNIPGLIRVGLGVIMVAVLGYQAGAHVTLVSLILFLLVTIASVVFLYASWFMILTLLIWFPRLDNLVDFLYSTSGLGKYPREVLKPFSGSVFIFLIVPFFLTVSVPTKQLLGEASPSEVIGFSLLALGLIVCSRFFWKFALRSYVGGSV